MIRVAIVGFGPRGLVALERVGAHLSETDFAATIDVFDSSRSDGWGVHDPDLPEFIRLNTIASQLTVYTDAEMVFPGAPTKPGPTFYEWVRDNGQTVVEYGDERRPERTDFLPRGLIGKYLAEAAARFTTDTDRLTVKVHRYEATAVRALSTGATVRTATDSTELRYDLVIIATGHGADRSARQLELDRVPPRRRLLLRGMGLTAMDLVAHLTVGRGGRFTRDTAGIFTYHPSGEEPFLTLTSRSGQLPAARPETDPYGRAHASDLFADNVDSRLCKYFTASTDPRNSAQRMLIDELSPRLNDREQQRLHNKLSDDKMWVDHETYSRTVFADARWDLTEASAGISKSNYKATLEALRTNREQIRQAVDDAHPRVKAAFFAATPNLINRLVIGPQKERIAELIALHQSGILQLGPGPDPILTPVGDGFQVVSRQLTVPSVVTVDEILDARETSAAASSLLPAGRIEGARLHTSAGPQSICVVGPPAEGYSYYNHYIPSPAVPSRAHRELDVILMELVGSVQPRVAVEL